MTFHVVARPDGTDLRTGTLDLRVGATIVASPHARLRLATSSIALITLGARDASPTYTPWRIFEVEALQRDWDHEAAMTDGFAYTLGSEVVVLAEVPLASALGFDPVVRARELQRDVFPRYMPDAAPLDDAQLDARLAEMFARCAHNHVRPDREGALANEVAATLGDAHRLASCHAELADYMPAVEEVARRFAADGQPEPWYAAAAIIRAHLAWLFVEPALRSAPNPLVNIFEPLADIVLGGGIVEWTGSSCVVRRLDKVRREAMALVAQYDDGTFTQDGVLRRLFDLAAETGVDEVLAELDPVWRTRLLEHFRGFDNDTPETEYVILEGVTVVDVEAYQAGLRARTEQMWKNMRTIRAWMRDNPPLTLEKTGQLVTTHSKLPRGR